MTSPSATPPSDEPPNPGPGQDPRPLLDGARSQQPILAPELDDLRRRAADVATPRDQRLEALEDIIASEVGDTNLARARNLERAYGLRQLFLKFEGGNPTGTQKDRIAFAHAADAVRRGFTAVTAATCGNYGVALALAAATAGLGAQIYIPAGFHTKRVQEMADLGASIVRHPLGGYEEAVAASMAQAREDEDLYDANPGGANTPLQLAAYGQIAYEIYDELRDAPAVVAVPASNGTTLAGIHRGFVSLFRRGKTSRIPRLVAGSSHLKNPIVASFTRGADRCEDLAPERIRETAVNEPLVNWHSLDGEAALQAVRKSGGWADGASDKAMRGAARVLREQEGLSVLPASTAGLLVLLERHRVDPLPGDRYVAILTGRR